jgi:hypothetical protein
MTFAQSPFDSILLEEFCGPVIHPTTGAIITKYQKLMKDPELKDVWTTASGKEFYG